MKDLIRRISLLLIACCLISADLFAQKLPQRVGKPVIDSSVYGKWPSVEPYQISNDGGYIVYNVKSYRDGNAATVIKAIHTTWKMELTGQVVCRLSCDSRQYIFTRNDSLGIGLLGQAAITYVPWVATFELFSKGKGNNWIVYRLKNQGGLVVRDLHTGEERKFGSAKDYFLYEGSQQLIIQSEKPSGDQQLKWVDMKTWKTKTVWVGKQVSLSANFDTSGRRLFFTGSDTTAMSNSIYYYDANIGKTIKLAGNQTPGITGKFEIDNLIAISKDWNKLFFTLRGKKPAIKKAKPGIPSVDVYSYKDAVLQSEQFKKSGYQPPCTAVFNLRSQKLVILGTKEARLISPVDEEIGNSDYVLLQGYDNGGEGAGTDEWNWNPAARYSIYLQSLSDGSIHLITKSLQGISLPEQFYRYHITPTGKYVVWYDPLKRDYYSYTIAGGTVRNITRSIPTSWVKFADGEDGDELIYKYSPVGIAGFLDQDKGLLIYDRHDIYQVDLSSQQRPLCLTDHYGAIHHIVFRLAMDGGQLQNKDALIVSAFDLQTKNDGFYRIHIGVQKKPEFLSMQPFIFNPPVGEENDFYYNGFQKPLKAKDAESCIVQRQNADEAPNLFYTKDFKHFERLTDLHPQRSYNWLTSELVTWKTFNGSLSQGVLYKPENFDPKKKYPLIFLYYERVSNELHAFPMPSANGAEIDIPTFVSNGYLVFTPDIHYPLNTGQGFGMYNCVVSAAQYLAMLPYVDVEHMGINGHSRGGFETNYLVTHTHMFAAAVSGCGYSDAISLYTRIRSTGNSGTGSYELTHQRIGATLWQKPQLYLENSPVLRADKVTTPLLMMNNKGDGDIPFEQGAQFFVSLRRLHKKAWMLQYDKGGHVLENDPDQKDFTLRMKQFFDHYLKGAPAPVWMTRGIPAKLKGQDSGLEIDTTGAKP